MIDICIIIFLLISFLYICYFCKSSINGGNTKKYNNKTNKNKITIKKSSKTNIDYKTDTYDNIIDTDLYSTPNSIETENNLTPLNLKDLKKTFSDIKFNIGNKVLLLKNNKLGIIINNKTDENKKYLIKLIDNNKEIYEYENYIKLI